MQKILIVDDIDTNRLLLRHMLSVMGDYTLIEAYDGKEGVDLFKKEQPDLVLMDVNMPIMDGYMAAAAIKSLSGKRHTPIIFITALSAEASLKNSLASGGDDFISKPFNAELLESKINAHLRIRELNEEINANNELLRKHNQHLLNEQELIEHFFENAIQQSFLDKDVIRYHMSSLSTFNGDVLFVKQGPEGGLYLAMGDFSGHGLTAAMGTLPVALIFFRMVAESAPVGNIARELNKELYKLMPPSMFFAASLIELNPRGDIMSVWMGGVPESYCINKDGQIKEVVHAQHMPLGILDDVEFDSATQIVNVEHGDKIYLYSDGVIEAKNSEGEFFGDERLQETLRSANVDRFDEVLKKLRLFTGLNEQKDDITLVELTCQALPAAVNEEHTSVNKTEILPPVLSWKLAITLTEKEMSSANTVANMSDILGSIPVLSRHKEVLHILLSEMVSNAIDHSILALESNVKDNDKHFVEYYQKRESLLRELKDACIKFEFCFVSEAGQDHLEIRMMDSGRGFHGAEAVNSDELLHGRGLGIIRSFCDKVTFSDDGKTLDVVYLM